MSFKVAKTLALLLSLAKYTPPGSSPAFHLSELIPSGNSSEWTC